MNRGEILLRLRDAASAYAKATEGLYETRGMGPAQLRCMEWEERARAALRGAIVEAEKLGVVELLAERAGPEETP